MSDADATSSIFTSPREYDGWQQPHTANPVDGATPAAVEEKIQLEDTQFEFERVVDQLLKRQIQADALLCMKHAEMNQQLADGSQYMPCRSMVDSFPATALHLNKKIADAINVTKKDDQEIVAAAAAAKVVNERITEGSKQVDENVKPPKDKKKPFIADPDSYETICNLTNIQSYVLPFPLRKQIAAPKRVLKTTLQFDLDDQDIKLEQLAGFTTAKDGTTKPQKNVTLLCGGDYRLLRHVSKISGGVRTNAGAFHILPLTITQVYSQTNSIVDLNVQLTSRCLFQTAETEEHKLKYKTVKATDEVAAIDHREWIDVNGVAGPSGESFNSIIDHDSVDTTRKVVYSARDELDGYHCRQWLNVSERTRMKDHQQVLKQISSSQKSSEFYKFIWPDPTKPVTNLYQWLVLTRYPEVVAKTMKWLRAHPQLKDETHGYLNKPVHITSGVIEYPIMRYKDALTGVTHSWIPIDVIDNELYKDTVLTRDGDPNMWKFTSTPNLCMNLERVHLNVSPLHESASARFKSIQKDNALAVCASLAQLKVRYEIEYEVFNNAYVYVKSAEQIEAGKLASSTPDADKSLKGKTLTVVHSASNSSFAEEPKQQEQHVHRPVEDACKAMETSIESIDLDNLNDLDELKNTIRALQDRLPKNKEKK